MNDLETKQYIQKLIEPLFAKIQELEKENNEMKKRVGSLETLIMTQSSRTYMKNTASRQNQLQQSMISRRDDENRSVSGGKQKPGWKSNTKIEQPKPVSKQPVHHEKIKLKPPIPRANSKTPTKMTDSFTRQRSPPIEKKIIGGMRIEADKKQNSIINQQTLTKFQSLNTPTKTNAFSDEFQDSASSKASKSTFIQLGQPNLYIQKDGKSTPIINSPRQTPPLDQSNVTEKVSDKIEITSPNFQIENMTKSQPRMQ